jgi:ATP synthase protein I
MVDKNDDKSNWMRQIGLLSVIPVIMVAAPVVGYLIGSWLDGYFGTEPWLTVTLIFLGFAAAGKEIYNILRRVNKDT